MQEFEIIFYKTDTGESPVEDFLDSLNDKMRAKKYRADYLSREEN